MLSFLLFSNHRRSSLNNRKLFCLLKATIVNQIKGLIVFLLWHSLMLLIRFCIPLHFSISCHIFSWAQNLYLHETKLYLKRKIEECYFYKKVYHRLGPILYLTRSKADVITFKRESTSLFNWEYLNSCCIVVLPSMTIGTTHGCCSTWVCNTATLASKSISWCLKKSLKYMIYLCSNFLLSSLWKLWKFDNWITMSLYRNLSLVIEFCLQMKLCWLFTSKYHAKIFVGNYDK